MRRTIAVGATSAAVFIGLAIAVTAGGLGGHSVDHRLTASSHRLALHHHAIVTAARAVTFFGSALVVDVATISVGIGLLLLGRRRDALVVFAVRISTWLLTNLVKAAADRPRPHFAMPIDHWSGSSFPSGHASGAASIVLPLAVIAVASSQRMLVRVTAVSGAGTVCVLVAASRVLLGAHFLSDVVAGVALAATLTALCWATAQQGFRVTGE